MPVQKEDQIESSPLNEQALAHAVNETVRENSNHAHDVEALVQKTSEKFIQAKVDQFPAICLEARRTNHHMAQFLRSIENEGGWSERKDFKLALTIPRDMYLFMKNLVYRDFWSDENRKIWRPFMKRILRGDDPMETLMWVKAIYGPNKDTSLIY